MKTTAKIVINEKELKVLIKETVMQQNKPFKSDDIFEEVLANPYFGDYCTQEELRKNVILSISQMWDIGYIRNFRSNSKEAIYVVD